MRAILTRRRSTSDSEQSSVSDRLAPSDEGANPFLSARREWNERYGSYVQQAAHWRMAAFGALAVAAIAVGWAGYRSAQSRFVPYVVRVNKLGDAVAVGPLRVAPARDSRVIVAQLARWVFEVRSVFRDARAEHNLLSDAYSSIAPDSEAYRSLNAWLQMHNPFKEGQNEGVTVTVHDVLPISQNVYRVTWTERRHGGPETGAAVQHWSAIVTIRIDPPASAASIMKNPMGVYITHFSWSRSVG